MINKESITGAIEEIIGGTDIFIVEIEIKTGNIVSVVLDSDTSINIDKCAEINRFICKAFEDAGDDDYELTVASAGLSEPLRLKRQYVKHIGEEVEIVCKSGVKNKGVLLSVTDEAVEIEHSVREKEEGKKRYKTVVKRETVGFESIKTTRLVIKV